MKRSDFAAGVSLCSGTLFAQWLAFGFNHLTPIALPNSETTWTAFLHPGGTKTKTRVVEIPEYGGTGGISCVQKGSLGFPWALVKLN